jgi:hypothetical protein
LNINQKSQAVEEDITVCETPLDGEKKVRKIYCSRCCVPLLKHHIYITETEEKEKEETSCLGRHRMRLRRAGKHLAVVPEPR